MRYRYREEHEMKDSGVEWLGKIPKDWEISKFKYVSELYTGNSIKDTEKDNYSDEENAYPYIATKDISIDYNTINYRNGMYTKISDKNFRVANTNSILLCIEGGSAGRKISYLNQNVSFVNKLCCIKPNKIQNKFQYYYCNSDSFKKEFSLNISGLIGGVSVNALKNFLIVKPKINEQEKIANFLDKKTSQFDLIISKKEKLIQRLEEAKKSLISEVVTGKVKVVKSDDGYELVKRISEEMKDSGVEWLGEIPKDWEVLKAARLANIVRGGSPRPAGDPRYFGGNEVPWITVGEVTKDENKYLNSVSSYLTLLGKEQSRFLEKGTLVMSNSGATLGVPKILNISGCINDGSLAFLNVKINKSYFYYLLKSRTEIFRKEMQISGQPNLNTDVVKSLYVLKPLESEQYIIAKYLDTKTVEINKLIDKSKKQIEKIKEAKQSLISEAVIGKIEILD